MNQKIRVIISLLFVFEVFNVTGQRIATGTGYSLAICEDSTVVGWGQNFNGVIGNTNEVLYPEPQQIQGISGVKALASETWHVLALKGDGTVWAWGINEFGQLGRGYTSIGGCYCEYTPMQVLGLSDVKAIACGARHSLALKYDGTVWAWGGNNVGQIGIDNNTDQPLPVQVLWLNNVTDIACGEFHSMARLSDGTLWVWGENDYGELGIGSTYAYNVPVQVTAVNNVIAMDGGQHHSIALKSDGTVWAWGWNHFGQVGNPTTGTWGAFSTPEQVPGLSDIVYIKSGYDHNIAVNSTGSVWVWGDNWSRQLADSVLSLSSVPILLTGIEWIDELSAKNHNLALKSDGTLWSWGANDYGELGYSTPGNSNSVPTQINVCSSPIFQIIGGIVGDTSVCNGAEVEYSISPVPTATNYTWTLPPGWYGTSNSSSISVIAAASSGEITVIANNADSITEPAILHVTGNPQPLAPSFIQNGSDLTCTVSASSYQWYLNGSSIANSDTITLYAIESGVYQVEITDANGCTAISDTSTANVPPAMPGTINGTSLTCEGYEFTFSIDPIPDAEYYSWSFPSGWTGSSTGFSISLVFSATSGYVSVTAHNAYGSSPAQLMYVTVNPKPTTPSFTQDGSILTCTAPGNLYYWYLNGELISNVWTSSCIALVDGNYQVQIMDVNQCISDTSLSQYIMVPPAQPGFISGDMNVCTGSENVYSIDPVSGAVDYTWVLPFGWSGSSTTTNITATPAATSGTIEVTANNANGSSIPQTKAVVGNPLPEDPTIDKGGDVLWTTVIASSFQWYYNNIQIPGAVNHNYIATEQGFYQVEITDTNGCMAKSDSLYVKPTDIDEIDNLAKVVIYPNPTSGKIIVELEDCMFCRIEVIDLTGQVIESVPVKSFSTELNLGYLSEGLYFIMVINDTGTMSFKLLKQ